MFKIVCKFDKMFSIDIKDNAVLEFKSSKKLPITIKDKFINLENYEIISKVE